MINRYGDKIFIYATLSKNDLEEIIALVGAEDNDPIVMISSQNQKPGVIEVQTGVVHGMLSGGGKLFEVKHNGKKWEIINRGSWVS